MGPVHGLDRCSSVVSEPKDMEAANRPAGSMLTSLSATTCNSCARILAEIIGQDDNFAHSSGVAGTLSPSFNRRRVGDDILAATVPLRCARLGGA